MKSLKNLIGATVFAGLAMATPSGAQDIPSVAKPTLFSF